MKVKEENTNKMHMTHLHVSVLSADLVTEYLGISMCLSTVHCLLVWSEGRVLF